MKELLLNTLLLVSLLSITATVAQAQTPTFNLQTPSVSTGAVSNPVNVTMADVNGDGNPDALVASNNTSQLLILLGNGTGGFTLQTSSPSNGVFSQFSNIAVADVNKDGNPDAVIGNASPGIGKILVLLGNGTGGFTLQANSPLVGTNNRPISVAVANVNADSNPDILAVDYYSGRLLVLLGDGTGGFTLQSTAPLTGVSGGAYRVAVADVNSDGKVDALVVNVIDATLGVLLGNGTGVFTLQNNSPVIYTNGLNGPQDLVIADVNGDNRPDVLTANTSEDTMGVLLGNGTGSFTSYGNYSVGASGGSYTPLNVAAADINGDGRLDALTTNYDNTISVFTGNGVGGFNLQPARLIPVTPLNNVFGLALSDVNRDGKPDVIAVNSANRTLMVFLNTTSVLATRATLPGTSAYLYPNPAQGTATLALTGLPVSVVRVQATLLDALGRMVGQYTLGAGGGSLPLTGLASGLYVVRLTAQDAQGLGLGELPVQRLSTLIE